MGHGPRVRAPREEAVEWYCWRGTGEDSLEGHRRRDPWKDRRLLPPPTPRALLKSHIFRPKERPL